MKKYIVVLVLLFVAVLTSCQSNAPSSNTPGSSSQEQPADSTETSYRQISAGEAKNIMDSGEEYILLDVRTEEEFKERRIEGAILIPHDEIESRAETELSDKGTLILVYCRSGNRSKVASSILAELGYVNVYEFGGIETDWTYDTISG